MLKISLHLCIFSLMQSLVSVTRYRQQIPWNNDFPVMVTNFDMFESISSELILVPHICTSFDWSTATLKFIKFITIKAERLFYFIFAISKVLRFMFFFHIVQIPEVWYPFKSMDSFNMHHPGSRPGATWEVGCYCLKCAGLAIAIHCIMALCIIYIANTRCVEFSCLLKCPQK